MRGDPLRPGDRITWSEYFIPGRNYFTEVLDLPQKSRGVDKYGHMAVSRVRITTAASAVLLHPAAIMDPASARQIDR